MGAAHADVVELVVAELHEGPAVPPDANLPYEGSDQSVEGRADAAPPALGHDARIARDPRGRGDG